MTSSIWIKINNCNIVYINSNLMNFYSTLARRNIIFGKQAKLTLNELLVCETNSVNSAVDNVNQVNWLDCDFIYENKKLYLVIKNSPFIEQLPSDILLFNKLLLNQADGGVMTIIKKPFTFSVDLGKFMPTSTITSSSFLLMVLITAT